MTSLRVDSFKGSVPLLGEFQLGQNSSAEARNCRVRSDDIVPLNRPVQITTVAAPFQKAYRLPRAPEDIWLTFPSSNVDVVEAPLVNETLGRVYWTDPPNGPKYSTTARLQAGQPALDLGVAAPSSAPVVTPPSGSNLETRAYLYTRVTQYGEESAPSLPASAAGDPAQAWMISSLVGDPHDASKTRLYDKIRVYRTVTGYTSASFFRVAELPASTTSFTDTTPNSQAALGAILQTGAYGEPPALEGMTLMPNGFIAGWLGRDIWFSVPYQPHAWPVNFVISVADQIVGMAVIGNVCFVVTDGKPHLLTGVQPQSVSNSRIDVVAPCVSKRSIVVHPNFGVLYASHNGLIRLQPGQVDLITRDLIDETAWKNRVVPDTVFSSLDDVNYTCINAFNKGFMLDLSNSDWFWIDDPVRIDTLWTDAHNGSAMCSRGATIQQWNPPFGRPLNWTWKSKKFDIPKPINIGAAQVRWEPYQPLGSTAGDAEKAWNQERITRPLAAIGYLPIGGVYHVVDPLLDPSVPDNRTSIGGSPLFSALDLGTGNDLLTLRVDCDFGTVWNYPLRDDRMVRPKEGQKAHWVQFTLSGTAVVHSAALAETGHELAAV